MFAKLHRVLPVPNRMLAALPRTEYQRLLPHAKKVALLPGHVLAEPGEKIKYIYFPDDVLVSLVAVVDRTHALEVALVGREGFIGVAAALGASAFTMRATVERHGAALRIGARAFRQEMQHGGALQREVLRYTHGLMAQIAHTAACNRFHLIEARLAHRLLLTRDRVGSNHFSLTHELLSQMLGVRRVGITTAAHALKARNLIDYSRGNIAITDGPGLEKVACTCYMFVKDIHGKT
jgi:CRP-like cAMP-binding protein